MICGALKVIVKFEFVEMHVRVYECRLDLLVHYCNLTRHVTQVSEQKPCISNTGLRLHGKQMARHTHTRAARASLATISEVTYLPTCSIQSFAHVTHVQSFRLFRRESILNFMAV